MTVMRVQPTCTGEKQCLPTFHLHRFPRMWRTHLPLSNHFFLHDVNPPPKKKQLGIFMLLYIIESTLLISIIIIFY